MTPELLFLCLGNRLKVMNTAFYQRKAIRKWTMESPDGKNQEPDILRSGKQQMEEQCYNVPDLHKTRRGLISQAGNGRIRFKLKTIHQRCTTLLGQGPQRNINSLPAVYYL